MNLLRLFVLFLVMALIGAAPSTAASPAADVVENLHNALLVAMKEGKKIGYQGRRDQLGPVIAASFDMPFIAKTIVGRYWETFNLQQRSRFVETFAELSLATYASHFDDYSGERFSFVSSKDLDSGQVLIQTRLTKSNGGSIELNYILRQVEKQWRIINIITDGVSDLALKRADYTAFLKTKDFDALITKLNEKIAQYSK